MHELSSLHKEHLLPQFAEDANSDIIQQIEIKTAEITRVSNLAKKYEKLNLGSYLLYFRHVGPPPKQSKL